MVQVLQTEQDLSTKRNAFQMLCNHAQSLAVNYLLSQVRVQQTSVNLFCRSFCDDMVHAIRTALGYPLLCRLLRIETYNACLKLA